MSTLYRFWDIQRWLWKLSTFSHWEFPRSLQSRDLILYCLWKDYIQTSDVNCSSVFCIFGMALTRHHWQCNWRVTWTSSRVYAGKRRTRRATICDNIQPYDKKHFCFCQMWHNFRLFFWKLPQFHASNVCKVVWQHIVRVLLEIYLAFQQWKNFENPLRIIDKVITIWVWCTTFLGHMYKHYT